MHAGAATALAPEPTRAESNDKGNPASKREEDGRPTGASESRSWDDIIIKAFSHLSPGNRSTGQPLSSSTGRGMPSAGHGLGLPGRSRTVGSIGIPQEPVDTQASGGHVAAPGVVDEVLRLSVRANHQGGV